jgi:DNA-binding response OmpR family regulator
MLIPHSREIRLILLVDDQDHGVIDLALDGHKVTRGRTWYDGRFCARHQVFDLVLLAAAIGKHDGLALCREIRARDKTVPIVVYCPDTPPVARERLSAAWEAGAQTCVSLHDGAGQLRQVVTRLIAEQAQRNMEATIAESCAITAQIRSTQADIEGRLHASRQAVARAREAALRSQALKVFVEAGGNQLGFTRLWPAAFEDALRQSYDSRR